MLLIMLQAPPVYWGPINLASVGVITVVVLALTEYLRRTFVTKGELNGYGGRLDVVEGGCKAAATQALDASIQSAAVQRALLEHVDRSKENQRRQSEHIERHLITPIQTMSLQLSEIQRHQAAQVEINKRVEAQLSDIRAWVKKDLGG